MRATLLALVLAACGGPALQSVKLTNSSPRPITEIYLYPLGAANHGVSRGTMAPNATLVLQAPTGNVEVEAFSATIELENHQREHRRASSAIELTGPAEVVFFDQGAKPVLPPKALGVPFVPPVTP